MVKILDRNTECECSRTSKLTKKKKKEKREKRKKKKEHKKEKTGKNIRLQLQKGTSKEIRTKSKYTLRCLLAQPYKTKGGKKGRKIYKKQAL